jgi:hypothetical protein
MAAPSNHYECQHQNVALRWRNNAAGCRYYRRQCLDCGEGVGPIVSAKVALDDGSLEPFDMALMARSREETRLFYEAKRAEWQARREAENQAWWDWYNAYLTTPAWKEKRAQALRRDKGVCQGCHARPATQVHHLSYKHAGDELLFELVSICDRCHDRAHADREEAGTMTPSAFLDAVKRP